MRRVLAGLLAGFVLAACGGGAHPDSVTFTDVDAQLYRGPAHCDWDKTWFVWIDGEQISAFIEGESGDVFSEALAGGSRWVTYVRDPDRIAAFQYEVDSHLDTELTDEITLVSLSDGSYKLWVDPADPHHLYVDSGSKVEAWALATRSFACE